MLGDNGIAMTLTKCRACGATIHILIEAKRNIVAK
jgi:recombinational DNA repair protein (RecF pathway)